MSAQINRKQCEIAKSSVKFGDDEKKNKTEQEEETKAVTIRKRTRIISEERMTDSQAAYLKP
ncbi:MAG TPA: hypothetical protein VFY39_07700 [Gammaproteobacteria bacterium]|nr:hypothetical protein [Gammaproteobacteria bacterium]